MRLKPTVLAVAIAAASAFLVSAVASQIALDGDEQAGSVGEPQSGLPDASGSGGYGSLLAELDQRIDGLQARVNDRPDDWLTRKHLGHVILERASLTNHVGDFERVGQVLDEAFAIAPEGSGPLMLAARFNFSIHRLDVAESYLDKMDRRAMQQREEKVAARALRAEIALQRGQYELAFTGLTEVAAAMPAAATVELALYHARTGEPAQAEALLEEALASTSPKDARRKAWTRMQLGLLAMDRGASLVALEHLQAADAELPGWWLVREHIAEVHDRLGDHGKAIVIYEELLRSTELPQLMDALASAYQHAGEPQKAQELLVRSAALWEEQLSRLPEAAMGHGLQHHLQFGTPARALELAKANYAARPGGEAQVALARAYLKAGSPAEALELAQRALATPYRTAGLHDVAAQAYAALGKSVEAQEQLELRAAINPAYQGQEHSH
jgi:tetratricopeptide (TPR) repeat protein